MAVNWTEEQKQVIDLRNRNILVSAAAGSGKTAVLVERIIRKITDPKNPVDIDRLLIMTFTRAAAGEMKERITAAIEKALAEDPDNEHLQRQTTLIHTAQITTIDGFCAYIIRNYFHLIGLDPGYRTGDEGELKLLREDVIKELLEDYYAEDQEKYKKFVECYASGKTDEGLGKLIQKVYDAAMSNPWPLKWLEECLETYQIHSEEELNETNWIRLLWECAQEELEEAKSLAQEAREICLEPGGPYQYEEALASDLLFIDSVREKIQDKDYDGAAVLLGKPSFARLSTKKVPDVEEHLKSRVKDLRDEEKTVLKELGARYFNSSKKEILLSLEYSREPVEMLVELTREFMERFAKSKREKNILDFTDMEHFALQILMTEEDGEYHMSQAARELSARYEEVMIDEYQDSNLVQELLAQCVSGWINQRKNIFMVGDVKQSIYRFRLARPELFMEKYKSYSTKDSEEQRIDLHKNFRSRHQVLDSVNYIFRQIMGEDLGGITYDQDAALYPGASFPEGENTQFLKTELLLVEKDGEELEDEQGNQNAQELEALAVAQKIKSIVGKEQIVDKETGEHRPVEYGDIVVLLRTSGGWSETFGQVLGSQGIPVYTVSRTGYFSTLEIMTVLNYLKICDNPLQDIPMAGVLRSPIGGCTTQELAVIRSMYPEGKLYESVCAYLNGENTPEEAQECGNLKEKLRSFVDLLEQIRDMAVYTPVHQLILTVLKETGYGNYVRAMPGGEQRYANLSMLVEKAMDYEKTSYRGLFNFVRYIEQLQKYEVDYGEVNLSGAGMGTVQIMTIHKSKGLEFPIVFVAGMGKQFNFQDVNASLLIHPELGIGSDAILPDIRVTAPSLNKQIIRRQLLKESLGEELRVLYVALTRAKEKLIMTGTVGKLEKLVVSLSRYLDQEEELLPVGVRLKAKNYWSFVLPALARHRCMAELFADYGIFMKKVPGLYEDSSEFRVEVITAKSMTEEEILHQTGDQITKELLINWDCGRIYDSHVKEEIEKRFSFRYPYEYLKDIPVKVSVSELKKRSWHNEYDLEEYNLDGYKLDEHGLNRYDLDGNNLDEHSLNRYNPHGYGLNNYGSDKYGSDENIKEENDIEDIEKIEIEPIIPLFISNEQEYQGAQRGTAYHRVMECLDYTKTDTKQDLAVQLDVLMDQKKLTQEQKDCINLSDVQRFVDSPLGKRMKKAAVAGKLYREQPFVISRKASFLNESWNGDETILIQGIIDGYFIEDGQIVLVDYKTDKIRKGEEYRLVERYHTQLEDYASALERMTLMQVKEKYIYSFTLHEEILV